MWFTSCIILFLVLSAVKPLFADDLTVSTDCPLSSQNWYPKCSNWEERNFDFVIVGGGTAGCTLANRLSENPNWNVLLIEAGGVPSNQSEIPGLYIALQGTSEDWAFKAHDPKTSTGYKHSVSSWAKGKALGGSSTINAMVVVPGVPEDYDRWAELGNEGWNWFNVTQYFDKVQNQLKITRYRSTSVIRDVLEEAVKELGIDTTGLNIFGYRDVPIQVYKDQRYSHAKAYLTPIKNRKNLCVATELTATGLWLDKNKTVNGVTVSDSECERTKHVKANLEVILSAGAINTPQLLMLSGIGPEEHLQTRGIPVNADLPVGQNLMDHMIIPVIIQDTANTEPTETLSFRLDQYCRNRTYLNNLGPTNFQGYLNTRNRTPGTHTDQQPTVEIIHFAFPPEEPMLNITLDRFGYLDYYQTQLQKINKHRYMQMILVTVLHPKSRGTVKLTNTCPYTHPKITPNYLSHPEDVQTVLEGISFIKKLIKTKSMNNYEFVNLGIPNCSKFKFKTPSYWKCYAKTFATTVYHPSGTCTMGNKSATSVVNPRLQVWGVPKLRVVDSSVIPELMSGHPNIPVGMIAEKAADIIKEDYLP